MLVYALILSVFIALSFAFGYAYLSDKHKVSVIQKERRLEDRLLNKAIDQTRDLIANEILAHELDYHENE